MILEVRDGTGNINQFNDLKSCIIEFLDIGDITNDRAFISKILERNQINSYIECIIFIDCNGNVKYTNSKCEKLTSDKCEKLIGTHIKDLKIDWLTPKLIKEGISEYHILKNDDDHIYLLRKIDVKDDEISSIIFLLNLHEYIAQITEMDLLKILNTIDKFRTLYQDYEFILDEMFDLITITDGEGKVTRMNTSAEQIFGQTEDKMLGKTMQEIKQSGTVTDSVTLRVLNQKKKVTLTQETDTGHRLVVTGIPLFDRKMNIRRIFNISRDITDINHLKNRLRETEELLNEYKQQINKMNVSRSEWKGLIVSGLRMGDTLKTAKQIMEVDSTVLIQGESGVGKEILARAIHSTSPRCSGPFIKVNCGAIVETLLESELFGYEKGSFTGALSKGKKGLAEAADKGVLFLDEIGDLSMSMQVKILELTQFKSFTPVGSIESKKVDIRIIAATNKNLLDMVKKGEFREDLYYRLNVIPIIIPPLRERKDEIPILVNKFMDVFTSRYKRERHITVETMEMLSNYDWPGNIREIENLIERLVVTCPQELITPQFLPNELKNSKNMSNNDIVIEINRLVTLEEGLTKMEKQLYKKAYQLSKNQREIAKLLGVHRTTVNRKIHKYLTNNQSDK